MSRTVVRTLRQAAFGTLAILAVAGSAQAVDITGAGSTFVNPVLQKWAEAYKAKTIIVNKRSMAAGYAGLDNELFYMDKTMMVFGDAKKVVEDMGKAIE